MREKILPRELGVDAHGDAVVLVGADVAIEHVRIALREIRSDAIPKRIEGFQRDRSVGIAPIDVLLARRFLDEELVLRRAPRVRARIDDQLAVGAEDTLATAYRVLDQFGNAEVLPELCNL
jgi:hypothetical protein